MPRVCGDHIEEWVASSLLGDEAARNSLMAYLEPIMRSFFISRIGSRVDVDDLVQNSLIRVFQSLGDVREPSSLKSFAMKGALYELHDYYRGRYRGKELTASDDLPDVVITSSEATAIDVARALESLSPHARRIIELREYGFRYAEIAEMVDSTEAAIKMQVKRAFERMKDLLVSLVLLVSLLLLERL
ncbi:MAG: RNA polymerase sigma factor [Rhodothermia bacterium]|nr:RNA polymerase sigma factor [Rhodothermia bacterium]